MTDQPEDNEPGADQSTTIGQRRRANNRLAVLERHDSDAESFTRTKSFDDWDDSTPSPSPGLNGSTTLASELATAESVLEGDPEVLESPTLSPLRGDLASPADTLSIPDDTPSLRASILSSPPSQLSTPRSQRPGALQPFDRRFSARLSPSPASSLRPKSPGFLGSHSRQSSIASTLAQSQDEPDTPQAPWEVVRWTKLKKISNQLFSEAGKRNYGRPTVIAISASIAVGTSKGLTLIFDYQQNLAATIGLGTKAVESGGITALAISADHSTIACGHSSGQIFTWELSRPAKPFLHIPPVALESRKLDGHIAETAVVHVGFLGTRHTALVSADEGGMAFSHLATRGLGAVARMVRTTRLLGRYPSLSGSIERPRKASSVLAFASLPLGNVEMPTDALGITAMLTPYLLVVVSTTPIAETQFKAARPKDIAPHSALSGCIAWFPAVKLKKAAEDASPANSKTKLVYCWSNILTILDVESTASEEKDKPPVLHFKPRSRWRGEESIVAVQWLHRSVLAVLTISQRLLILEDGALKVTDSFDLLHKHIYHQDLFSRQLRSAVEQLDDEDQSMHGVVADAFHMSFRAYKGRLFLLGFNDVSIGTLSNWADRLVALMEEGDYIAAIELATLYYSGETDKVSIGLPENDQARRTMVREKLLEMILASLRYTFSQERDDDSEPNEKRAQLKVLAVTSFEACKRTKDIDFLFDHVYEAYGDASHQDVFFEVLEPCILNGEINAVPPPILKDLMNFYAAYGRETQLEEMICRLNTATMDINQVTALCKSHKLYDALIYVWNQALNDYVTPFIELMHLINVVLQTPDESIEPDSKAVEGSSKIFPYLAYGFTGRIYPHGGILPEDRSYQAKEDLYRFLFSGRVQDWPPGSGRYFHPAPNDDDDEEDDVSYPYVSLILQFDTPSFMSVLNEAFEDSFLNGPSDQQPNGANTNGSRASGKHSSPLPTRQTVISILIDVMNSGRFGNEDSIYLDMFIARNLPKFPQFIILPGGALHKVLENLCNYPSDAIAEDCQLSVEYLLSFYHPPDLSKLIAKFHQAKFYRVLKSVYRSIKQYPQLLQTYFDDPNDRESIFNCIRECTWSGNHLTPKQTLEVETIITDNATELCGISAVKTAQALQSYAPQLITPVFEALEEGSYYQFTLLKTLIEPADSDATMDGALLPGLSTKLEQHYVRLMCKYDPGHVADYVSLLKSGDLELHEVLPAMEESGVVDAAVVLMVREGLVAQAMDRLTKHLTTLKTALIGLIKATADSPDISNTEEAVDDLLEAIHKYCKVGIWLCQGETRATEEGEKKSSNKRSQIDNSEENLGTDEKLWLHLVDGIVTVTKDTTVAAEDLLGPSSGISANKITSSLRSAVQQTFTALLTSTARPKLPTSATLAASLPQTPSTQPHPAFLRILRAFLTRASRSSPSLHQLRTVLHEIFAAYTFEQTILEIANHFLDKDLFVHVDEAHRLRQKGWRPRGNVCEKCRRRVWGPGAGSEVWDAWDEKRQAEEAQRRERWRAMRPPPQEDDDGGRSGRGKGKAMPTSSSESPPESSSSESEAEDEPAEKAAAAAKDSFGPIVVFACRHIYHRACLTQVLDADKRFAGWRQSRDGEGEFECPLEKHGSD